MAANGSSGKLQMRIPAMARLSVRFIRVVALLVFVAPNLGFVSYPYADEIIGSVKKYRVKENESLLEIARKFDIGMNEIADANPGVDPIIPDTGSLVEIPSAWILPDVPVRAGIVINVSEFRLYFFPTQNSGEVLTFPIGVGDEGKDTPTGTYKIIEKIVDPSWYVPESIRREKPELPRIVPPGPDNPMGSRAMRLSMRSILIHGTDRPWGIGTRSSHGCLRLYPEDIVRLFNLVPLGTRVEIVNQPLKATLRGDRVFVEAHRYQSGIDIRTAIAMLERKNLLGRVDILKLKRVLEEMKGMPVDVTR